MPGNRYLLLGWRDGRVGLHYVELRKAGILDRAILPGRIFPIVKGDAIAVIKAAAAANCPVLLIDSADVPTVVTSAMMDSNAQVATPSTLPPRSVAAKSKTAKAR